MRENRVSLTINSCILIFFLLISSSALGFAQESTVMGVRIHKFQPAIPPQSVSPTLPPKFGTSAGLAIGTNAMNQINALILYKRSRTPVQNKINSQLLFTARMLLGKPVTQGVPSLETGVELDDAENFLVDISADVTEDLLTRLRKEGVRIMSASKRYHSILAFIPPDRMEEIAGWQEVRFIRPRAEAVTNLIVSEGDKTHEADLGRSTFGVTGAGLKVGVISDGVTNLAASQSLGELGAVTVLPGQTGSGDEGTAMLEIIHDLAPGASLYFAYKGGNISGMAQNILDLRAAGCDIIVDDITYLSESPFQDGQTTSSSTNGGIVTQAINEVVADGALYFSSAANSGNLDDSSSGTYEHDFVDGGAAPAPLTGAGSVHVFNSQPLAIADQITSGSGSPITLHWSDPLGASSNDYDIYVLDQTGSYLVATSDDQQNGSQDAFEAVPGSANATGNLIVIIKFSGSARFLHLATNRGKLFYATSGATIGHNAARNAFSLAATPAYQPFTDGAPAGPYPFPFSGSDVVEQFSSDGPRRIFFQADGTAITPGDYLSTGGELLQKPDFTAADGVSVSGVGDFASPFFGTSAAAPHAAAIAALIKSAKPDITNAEMYTAFLESAIDIMSTGWDRNSGNGIIMAYAALNSIDTGGPTAPTVTTSPATDVGMTTATLNGTVNPKGASTTGYFQYGLSTGYGNTTSPQNLGAGTAAVPIAQPLDGLTCNMEYHFRAVATNSVGTSYGADKTFTTTDCLPNLAPYKPAAWSDKIVVSKVTGTNTDNSPLQAADTLYVDWAVINSGSAATEATFYSSLYVDEVLIVSGVHNPPLDPNYYSYVSDYSIGSLSAGTHTLRIVADATNAIAESSEADNEYTKTITILSGSGVRRLHLDLPVTEATVTDAFANAQNTDTIQAWGGPFDDSPITFSPAPATAVKFSGGWNDGFGTQNSMTTLHGLTVGGGALLTVEDLIIQ